MQMSYRRAVHPPPRVVTTPLRPLSFSAGGQCNSRNSHASSHRPSCLLSQLKPFQCRPMLSKKLPSQLHQRNESRGRAGKPPQDVCVRDAIPNQALFGSVYVEM